MPKDTKQHKQWFDVTAEDANKLIELFVQVCRVGVELGMSTNGMAGALLGFAARLKAGDHDLQFYVDHPDGDPGKPHGPITEEDMDRIRRERLLANMPKGKPDA
jgi:hypothetical protein